MFNFIKMKCEFIWVYTGPTSEMKWILLFDKERYEIILHCCLRNYKKNLFSDMFCLQSHFIKENSETPALWTQNCDFSLSLHPYIHINTSCVSINVLLDKSFYSETLAGTRRKLACKVRMCSRNVPAANFFHVISSLFLVLILSLNFRRWKL